MTPEELKRQREMRRIRRQLADYARKASAHLHDQLDELIKPNIKDIVAFLLNGGGIKVNIQLAAPEGVVDATAAPEPEPPKPLIEVVSG